MLSTEDFEFDADYDESIVPPQRDYNTLYVIATARLAIICRLHFHQVPSRIN